jgi:hypothetical protein
MVALSANLAGEVGRDTRAIVGLLEFLRLISEGLSQGVLGKPIVYAAPSEIGAGGNGITTSTFARPNALPAALLAQVSAQQAIDSEEVVEVVLNCVRALVSFLIVGGLAL